MPLPFLAVVAIAVGLQIVAYLLAPKPKRDRGEATRELENPTAEAGREVGVIFGTVLIKDPNIIWYGDKAQRTRKVKV